MKKKCLIILCVLFFYACKKGYNESYPNELESKKFFNAVDEYIEDNPLNKPLQSNLYENGFSYPSYQIYFNIKNSDTIMSILQTPFFNNINYESIDSESGEDIFESLNTDGFLMYKEKYPLVFFNLKNYYNSQNVKKDLNNNIPDSLKFNKENYHLKFVKWDYKIKNKEFIRID